MERAPEFSEVCDGERLIAEVAVDGAFASASQGVLSYAVPEEIADRIAVGELVWVPLRNQLTLGLVTSLVVREELLSLKPVRAVVEPSFALSEKHLDTVRWLAREYASSIFAAAAPFFPPGVTHRAVEHLRVTERGQSVDESTLPPVQRKLLLYLRERDAATLDASRAALGAKLTTVVARLEAAGLIHRIVRVVDSAPMPKQERFIRLVRTDAEILDRAPKQRAVVDFLEQRARLAAPGADGLVALADVLERTGSDRATVTALARKGVIEERSLDRGILKRFVEERPAPSLTAEQAEAWKTIEAALDRGDPKPILLHGVTGSGKTELYLRAVAWALRREKSAIILVPEIALASQVVRRFQSRFPGQVAVLHSAMPDRERYASWQSVASGEMQIVVGPRSALFAPVRDLGVIVLDEEHEGAYKQESEPRYHARALAEHLAAREECPVLLGSATPSIETFWRAETGAIERLRLAERVGQRRDGESVAGSLELPPVEVVDMRLELHRGRPSIISQPLTELIATTLEAREQSILFLNRRGTATVVLCRSCGHALSCPNCDIPLVYHQDRARLLCHRCNHRELPLHRCPECTGPLNYFGAGTQRVEDEIKSIFPAARVLRWDQDSVRRNGGHEKLLHIVERREADIVVGTQMVAKGLDLPMVTAIGVVHADTMLHLPDFRAAERTFQLLTQVAGRAGRRTSGSNVIIQSFSPDHYAIKAASTHDYIGFYREEIDFRKKHRYPPYARLIRFLFRHHREEVCAAESEELARLLVRHARSRKVEIDLIGPTPAFASKVRGKHQWHIILRSAPATFESLLDGLPVNPGWTTDIDPQSLL